MSSATPSWETAKKVLTQADMERLACAFLTQDGVEKLNVDAAAAQFGGNIKPASFKRSIWVILKKVREAVGENGGKGDGEGNEGMTGKGKGKGKGKGRKRKADDDADEDGEGEAKPAAKKGQGGRKGKKSPAEVNGDGDGGADDETTVKAEDEDNQFN